MHIMAISSGSVEVGCSNILGVRRLGIVELITEYSGGSTLSLALILSSIAMLSTTLGGLPVVLVRGKEASDRGFSLLVDLGLGFSSGVMLVASFTSLLLPAM